MTKKTLIRLLNGMTYQEKMDILLLDYEMLWKKVYHANVSEVGQRLQSVFALRKASFNQRFLTDDRKYLKELINNTTNTSPLWEFPKGHSSEDMKEGELDTAKREFYEETGIESSKLRILYAVKPYIVRYKDFGTDYTIKYFYATLVNCKELNKAFKVSNCISNETDCCKWIDKNELRYLDLPRKSIDRLYRLFDNSIKRCKTNLQNIDQTVLLSVDNINFKSN